MRVGKASPSISDAFTQRQELPSVCVFETTACITVTSRWKWVKVCSTLPLSFFQCGLQWCRFVHRECARHFHHAAEQTLSLHVVAAEWHRLRVAQNRLSLSVLALSFSATCAAVLTAMPVARPTQSSVHGQYCAIGRFWCADGCSQIHEGLHKVPCPCCWH